MEQILIDKLVFGGQGIGKNKNGQAVFVWNALPGEKITVDNWQKRSGILTGTANGIIDPSPHRIKAEESHFLSCSPWQIMDWNYENEQKIAVSTEVFKRAKVVLPEPLAIFTDDMQYGYRNKMEFSFTKDDAGQISLALFDRNSHDKVVLSECKLANPAINEVAQKSLSWIKNAKIPFHSLEKLIVRNNRRGRTIAGLSLQNRPELNPKDLAAVAQISDGFWLYYSTRKSTTPTPPKILYHSGVTYLEEEILGRKLRFGLFSFFQINTPVFEKALEDMKQFAEPGTPILDLYSGVGAIGITLGQTTCMVDNHTEAIDFARDNIRLNGPSGCTAVCIPTEKSLDMIKKDEIIVCDPPRSGLHNKVIEKILVEKPKRSIYLSCDISTQARDIALLASYYQVDYARLYNFFPRTPHIESLIILNKK